MKSAVQTNLTCISCRSSGWARAMFATQRSWVWVPALKVTVMTRWITASTEQTDESVFTDGGDHPHQHVCEAGDPDGRHQEGDHVAFPPEASPAVGNGQEQQHDDRQRQNPQDPLQIVFWHREHALLLWERDTCERESDENYSLLLLLFILYC